MLLIRSSSLIILFSKVCQGALSGDARIDNLGPTALAITDYYDQMTDEVDNKQKAGFNTTITDIWGRSLSFQLFNAIDGGPSKHK